MIDTTAWKEKGYYSMADGRNGPVKVMHTPNHRGFKGTEFLIQAVDELREEGLQIELVLLEKVPNSRVRDLMQEVDILAEQFISVDTL
jgi:predicted metal-dependent TIM-barrel fold hydrolase